MRTITPKKALQGREWVIVESGDQGRTYELYPEEGIARRVCRDLNARYGEGKYHVAKVDFGDGPAS